MSFEELNVPKNHVYLFKPHREEKIGEPPTKLSIAQI